MRPIVNLGKDSVARFKVTGPATSDTAAAAAAAALGNGGITPLKRKCGRRQTLTMQFKPVNTVLQGSYHVGYL